MNNQIMKQLNRFGLGALVLSATIAMGSFGYTMLTSTLATPTAVTGSPAVAIQAESTTVPEATQRAFTNIQSELAIQPEREQRRVRNNPRGSRRGQDGSRHR
ncbi:MAG: hypothetical protein AAF702_23685 [Chloroflexota bacterium]